MDLELFGRVVWRHKIVVGVGIVLAVALAALSYVRVNSGGVVTYRDQETWISYETVSVTQRGFTEGRLNYSGADPTRLTYLAVLYSHYVDADEVQRAIWPKGANGERIEAAAVLSVPGSSSASALPLISIAAFSETSSRAKTLAESTAQALKDYIAARQVSGHVPEAERVVLQPVRRAADHPAVLWQGRSKSLPIVVFVTVLVATIGLAFILENLDPQIRRVAQSDEETADVRQQSSLAS
jgi:hypothetical protein